MSDKSDNWDSYVSNVNDGIASFLVNLGLFAEAPRKTQGWMVSVCIYVKEPCDKGLLAEAEAEILHAIENTIVKELSQAFHATYVGRSTVSGRFQLYFYTAIKDQLETLVKEVMQQFPQYNYDYLCQKDPDWSLYLNFLYPSPLEFQCMLNARILNNLKKAGNDLLEAKDVEHTLYFSVAKNCQDFINAVRSQGFSVVEEIYDDNSNPTLPIRLKILRSDHLNRESLDQVVTYLYQLAQRYNGDYDCWAVLTPPGEEIGRYHRSYNG